MGAKFKIATTVLGDRRVGQIVENPGLNADETANTSTEPDGTWKMGYPICVVVRKGDGTELKKQITVV